MPECEFCPASFGGVLRFQSHVVDEHGETSLNVIEMMGWLECVGWKPKSQV